MRKLLIFVFILGITVSAAVFAAPTIYIRNQEVTAKVMVRNQKIYLPVEVLQDRLGVKLELEGRLVKLNGEALAQPVLLQGGVYYAALEEAARKAGFEYLYSKDTQMVDIFKAKPAEVKTTETSSTSQPAEASGQGGQAGTPAPQPGTATPSGGPGVQPSLGNQPSGGPGVQPSLGNQPSGGPGVQPSLGNQPSGGPGVQPSSGNQPSGGPGVQPSGGVSWFSSLTQAMDEAYTRNKNIFLFCYNEGPESRQMQELFSDTQVIKSLENFICLKLDKAAANDYNITSFPKVAVLSSQGVTLDSYTGAMGLSSFINWLKKNAQPQ
jgi:hypothetical protein